MAFYVLELIFFSFFLEGFFTSNAEAFTFLSRVENNPASVGNDHFGC